MHELAERLHMTVGQLARSITSDEITDWLAYDRIRVPQSWQQFAQLCHLVACLVLGRKAPKYESFLPARYRPKPQPMTSAAIRAALAAAAPREPKPVKKRASFGSA